MGTHRDVRESVRAYLEKNLADVATLAAQVEARLEEWRAEGKSPRTERLEFLLGELSAAVEAVEGRVKGSKRLRMLAEELRHGAQTLRTQDDEIAFLGHKVRDVESEALRLKDYSRILEADRESALRRSQALEGTNNKLAETLKYTKAEIQKLKEEVQKLKSPPFPYGVFVGPSEGGELAVVNVEGREYEVNIANEEVKLEELKPGQRLLLNGAYNILDVRQVGPLGEVVKVIDFLGGDRIIIKSRENEDRVARVADTLRGIKLKIGDNLRYDDKTGLVYEQMPKSEVEDVVLEEIPKVSYEDIGGLEEQIEKIKDSIELPYVYSHLYTDFKLKPPKGILLYGPPGCGKTLVAKAVAYNLAQRVKRSLEDTLEAMLLYNELSDPEVQLSSLLDRFEALKARIYSVQEVYHKRLRGGPVDPEELKGRLDKAGLLGDFLRRTEGHHTHQEWLDFLFDINKMGYGALDEKIIGEMLESKRKKYLMKKKSVSDREYMLNWLAGLLKNNGIKLENLDRELERTRARMQSEAESYFLNIKGPELLNKYVGETEHKIREVFIKAREKAEYGLPVIVFFDEMESLFRTRGSGISSDVESTIVPQFLAEIDGVEKLENVIVIGASNRQDLIDPAVLRPGRLDIKIKVDRPDKDGAAKIFSIYLTTDIPLAEEEVAKHDTNREAFIKHIITEAVEEMYSTKKENEFLRVTYKNGDEETLYFKDFASGAMIEGIVSRAKKMALKRTILTGERGLRLQDLLKAIRGEYKENEDLPNTTNPDDWSRISGRKGEKIVAIKTLMPSKLDEEVKDTEEHAVSSRYL
jgi:ATP-dependent 26S proteasome regulatory subunit